MPRAAARSASTSGPAALRAAGFEAHIPTGRNRRPGFSVRLATGVPRPGIYVFDHCGSAEFARMCEALVAAGYTLTDAEGGSEYVARGCARARRPAAQS